MSEEGYMEPRYCLECAWKHSRDLEHHIEDLLSAKDEELKLEALDLKEKIREIRKKIDELRMKEKLKEIVGEKVE